MSIVLSWKYYKYMWTLYLQEHFSSNSQHSYQSPSGFWLICWQGFNVLLSIVENKSEINHILKNLRNSDWSYTNILFSLFGTRASLSLVSNETYTTPELYPIKYRAEPCVIELNVNPSEPTNNMSMCATGLNTQELYPLFHLTVIRTISQLLPWYCNAVTFPI